MKKTLQNLILGVACAALLPIVAFASPILNVNVPSMDYANATTVQIHSTVGNINESVYAGAFLTNASDTVGSFESWCVDILQATIFNSSVSDYARTSGQLALTSQQYIWLGKLATEALAQVHDAQTSAAFQLATWEIVDETSGKFDLASGSFSATNASDKSIAQASLWLDGLMSQNQGQQYQISVLVSPTRQDLAVFAKVPEPSTIAVLAAGLLAFCLTRRRRGAQFS